MHPDPARPLQGCEKQAFTTEESGFDPTNLLNIELDLRFHSDNTAGVDMKHFSGLKGPMDYGAAGMEEYQTVPVKLLHDKSFAAEQAGKDFALKKDAYGNAFGGTEKAVLLAYQAAADLIQMNRDDISGVGGAEGNPGLALPGVGEYGHKQAFPCQQAFAGPPEACPSAHCRPCRFHHRKWSATRCGCPYTSWPRLRLWRFRQDQVPPQRIAFPSL